LNCVNYGLQRHQNKEQNRAPTVTFVATASSVKIFCGGRWLAYKWDGRPEERAEQDADKGDAVQLKNLAESWRPTDSKPHYHNYIYSQ